MLQYTQYPLLEVISKKKAYCLAALSICSLIFAIVALTAFEGPEVTYFNK